MYQEESRTAERRGSKALQIVRTVSNYWVERFNVRSSNFELYRIICMLLIIAHHYVVNSGLTSPSGPLMTAPTAANSLYLTLMGGWGKTGINCFLMITGYFMCTSRITMRKFLKLIGQIYLYNILLFIILLIAGYETLSLKRFAQLIIPFWGFSNNFLGCFIVFYLTIPFWNILVHNMSKRQHELLLVLILGMYTVLGSIPSFTVTFNYVTWFSIIYLIASFIRLYPRPLFENRRLWAWLTIINVLMATLLIVCICYFFQNESVGRKYFFVSDCNKIFAVTIAVCSFLWFKNIKIKQSKLINAFGAGTFGVLLIHANSDAMRHWLWGELVSPLDHYSLPLGNLIIYSLTTVLAIFIICNIIDQFRIVTVEKWALSLYDSKLATKAESWINRLTESNS